MNKIFTALAFLLASSFQVEAAQILVQSSPTESTVAVVSRNEPNLFQIEGRKIKRIYGTEGLFTVTPEADTGVAWLKPLTDKNMLSVFITDDTDQHFKILLDVKDIPAETVIIRGKNNPIKNLENTRNEPRNEEILGTVIALYNGEGDAKSQLIPLWKGVKFELVSAIELRGIKGESYLLTNHSGKQIVMDEREFYREGVQAVVIQNQVLKEGESTPVYVISEGE
jgi:conjugal transfer pilus assembly protein TraK